MNCLVIICSAMWSCYGEGFPWLLYSVSSVSTCMYRLVNDNNMREYTKVHNLRHHQFMPCCSLSFIDASGPTCIQDLRRGCRALVLRISAGSHTSLLCNFLRATMQQMPMYYSYSGKTSSIFGKREEVDWSLELQIVQMHVVNRT